MIIFFIPWGVIGVILLVLAFLGFHVLEVLITRLLEYIIGAVILAIPIFIIFLVCFTDRKKALPNNKVCFRPSIGVACIGLVIGTAGRIIWFLTKTSCYEGFLGSYPGPRPISELLLIVGLIITLCGLISVLNCFFSFNQKDIAPKKYYRTK